MPDSTTISIPKELRLPQRIAEVRRQITAWIDSLDKPFNSDTDNLQLKKSWKDDASFSYQYNIDRDVKNVKGSSSHKSLTDGEEKAI